MYLINIFQHSAFLLFDVDAAALFATLDEAEVAVG
jgi:hypothetical protein